MAQQPDPVTRQENEIQIRDGIPDYLYRMKYYLVHANPHRVIWYWKFLTFYLWLHGRSTDLIECENYVLTAAKQIDVENRIESQQIQALASIRLAQAYMDIGELDQAEVYLRKAEVVWHSFGAGDKAGPAGFLRFQARLAFQRKDFSTALRLCQQALKMTDEAEAQLQNQKEELLPKKRTIYYDATMYPLQNMEQVLKLRTPLYYQLAAIYVEYKDYSSACTAYIRTINIARQLPKKDRVNYSLASFFGLANVLLLCSNWTRARLCYNRCLDWTRDGTRPSVRAGALFGLAKIAAEESEWNKALNQAQDALSLYETAGRYNSQNQVLRFIKTIKGKL